MLYYASPTSPPATPLPPPSSIPKPPRLWAAPPLTTASPLSATTCPSLGPKGLSKRFPTLGDTDFRPMAIESACFFSNCLQESTPRSPLDSSGPCRPQQTAAATSFPTRQALPERR